MPSAIRFKLSRCTAGCFSILRLCPLQQGSPEGTDPSATTGAEDPRSSFGTLQGIFCNLVLEWYAWSLLVPERGGHSSAALLV